MNSEMIKTYKELNKNGPTPPPASISSGKIH